VKLKVGPGGFVQVVDLDGFVAAYVRFRLRDDGRLRADALLLDAYNQPDLDVQKMRRFPLAAVEVMANTPEYFVPIERDINLPTEFGIWAGESQTVFRWVSRRTSGMSAQLKLPAPSPDHRGRYPDTFYVEVGAVYRFLVERVGDRAPAQTLADANAVPVSTVHRWIREARRRGILRPAGAQGVIG
jgi:hypothetical protein